jgi:penicillin-binding protein 1B
LTVKIKIANGRKGTGTQALRAPRGWRTKLGKRSLRITVSALLIAVAVAFGVFALFYLKYENIVDRRMRGQIFTNAARIYAHPRNLRPGDKFDARQIITSLRRAGYNEDVPGDLKIGVYKLVHHGIQIEPGPNSYHTAEGATITGTNGKIDRINSMSDGRELGAYELEPELITALFEGEQRSKRRLIRYEDIPQVLIDAVLSIEDRRFFQHGGVNYYRLVEAAWVDFRTGRYEQGGSTITMQLSRGFFLTPEKTKKRKMVEMLISMILEDKFSKKQIFELYANQVYMGQRGSFTITGFGQAAQAYFGKEVKNLNIPEAALLAGIIQRPNYYSPYKYPERALDRRNLVIEGMVDTGSLTRAQADRAKAAPLKLAPPNVEASEAPYFVDLVKDTLLSKYNERELNDNAYRIYTTLDPELQRDAAEAVEIGIKEIDAQVTKLRTHTKVVGRGKSKKKETIVTPGPQAQVALVAIDPASGEVLALVGGRNYGMSQLNHAISKRPTGSVFKPFVYAAAVNTAIDGSTTVLTPSTIVDDSPTTFTYGDQIYEPRNYREEYHGPVTARYALALSLNNATVKLAEEVGYDKVAALAKAAGIKSVVPTPAMALGSYDATPLDMAGAYTVFADGGTHVTPILIDSLRDAKGNVIENFTTRKEQVMDPRVAYVMTDMLQGTLNFGTAYEVRTRGFTAPAAGKTGTSHDGWFAGYTSNLLCVVWVGFDDYSDLRLSGASTAAPVWAEFMKRAIKEPGYTDVQPFSPPSGVVAMKLDKVSNLVATPTCPDDYVASFIIGTEPKQSCDQMSADQRGFFSRILGLGAKPAPPPAVSNTQPVAPPTAGATPADANDPSKKKQQGFWGKIFGATDDKKQPAPPPAPSPSQSPPPAANPAPGQSPPKHLH